MRTLLESTTAYKLIENANQKLHHAYLILFPDAVFLKNALPFFASLVLGEKAEKRILENAYPDCVRLPEEDKKFSTADAETVEEEAFLKPIEGDRKLFLINDFSEATPQAQNKLLKILEEPPEGVYFILGASLETAILPTVLSRVERLELQPFSSEQIEAYLKRNHPDLPFIKEAAEASGGLPSRAEELLTGGFLSELSQIAFQLLSEKKEKIPALSKKYGETKRKKELLSLLGSFLRDALVIKSEREKGVVGGELLLPAQKNRSEALSNEFSFFALFQGLSALSKAEKNLRFNAAFSQTLELTLLALRLENEKT